MNKFAVTLNYNCNYGFVEYNEENKTAVVTLSVAEAKQKVEKFFANTAYLGYSWRVKQYVILLLNLRAFV